MACAVYRDDEDAVRSRIEEVVAEQSAEAARYAAVARPILERRASRIAAGLTGLAGGVAMFGSTLFAYVGHSPTRGLFFDRDASAAPFGPTHILLGSWCAMAGAYVIGGAVARAKLDAALTSPYRPTSHPRRDLDRLLATKATAHFEARLARSEAISLSAPLAAVALLGPLTIHLLVYAFLLGGLAKPHYGSTDFDGWIALSTLLTGLAHLCLVACALELPRKLTHAGLGSERRAALSAAWRTLLWTTCASALPGAVYILIPCILTAITGAILIPPAFMRAGAWLRAERSALATL